MMIMFSKCQGVKVHRKEFRRCLQCLPSKKFIEMIFQDTYKKGPKDADGLPYKLKKIETKIKRLQYSRMFIDCMTRQSHLVQWNF